MRQPLDPLRMQHSRYYAEACNEWRGPSLRCSAWAAQLRRHVKFKASGLNDQHQGKGKGTGQQVLSTHCVDHSQLAAFTNINQE